MDFAGLGKSSLDTVRRMEISQAVVDRFNNQALVLGEADCIRVLACAVTAAGWPDPGAGFAYRNAAGARRALAKAGFEDLAAAVDGRFGFQRIPLSRHLPGDIVWFPSDDTMGAIGVAVGNGKALAFVDAGVAPGSVARMQRRLAGFDHRLAAARKAAKAGKWSNDDLTARTAGIEARRAAVAAVLADADAPPVRALCGSIHVALVCWRLEQCPR